MLFVGDVHATAPELQECGRLIDGICGLSYKTVVFLGDQMHTHSVLNLDVIDFWQQASKKMREAGKTVYMLVGNHDMSTAGRGPNAMQTIFDVNVVGGPTKISPGLIAIPYCHSHEDFDAMQRRAKDMCSAGPEPTLVCHQTFAGAQYENGFYAPDGFPLDKLLFKSVISGHIHTHSLITAAGVNVWYIGSPRWRSQAEAGIEKYLVGFSKGMYPDVEGKLIPTNAWCSPIEVVEDEDDSVDPVSKKKWANSRFTVIVRGDIQRVRARVAELKARGIAVLPRPSAQAAPRVSEAAPVMASFHAFLKAFKAPRGTTGQRLADAVMGYKQWQSQ